MSSRKLRSSYPGSCLNGEIFVEAAATDWSLERQDPCRAAQACAGMTLEKRQ